MLTTAAARGRRIVANTGSKVKIRARHRMENHEKLQLLLFNFLSNVNRAPYTSGRQNPHHGATSRGCALLERFSVVRSHGSSTYTPTRDSRKP